VEVNGKLHTWTGNTGTGTSGYGDYQRTREISAAGKPTVPGSSDPAFRGDPARWNRGQPGFLPLT
jgi:hypothetical protein